MLLIENLSESDASRAYAPPSGDKGNTLCPSELWGTRDIPPRQADDIVFQPFLSQVMPFSLNNTGTTFRRAITVFFKEMLKDMVNCFVDDLVVKSQERSDHLKPGVVFNKLSKHHLKVNRLKCEFEVNSGNSWDS